jgi:hypothetical protein
MSDDDSEIAKVLAKAGELRKGGRAIMGRADTLILGVDAAEAAWALDDDRFGSRIDGHGVAQGRLMNRILFTTALSIMTCPIGVISRSFARKRKFCGIRPRNHAQTTDARSRLYIPAIEREVL